MYIGFMGEMSLSEVTDIFLFECRIAGWSLQTRRRYRDVLTKFIKFTGNITVQDLKPDHVRAYIADLADCTRHSSLAKHYAVIRTWIRWLYAQKNLTESRVEAPRFPARSFWFLASESCKFVRDLEQGF
jgi:site-specific recombinase XerD